MSKIRNPSYAPEYLERKLNPSAGLIPVPAEVQVMTTAAVNPAVTTADEPPIFPPSDPYPPSGNGNPPIIAPTIPGGNPSGPARMAVLS